MNNYHKIDQDFNYVSPFLKKALIQYAKNLNNDCCLDIPCGNGRNTFLLAKYFRNVTAIDINELYLRAIKSAINSYMPTGQITTIHADVLKLIDIAVSSNQFICNIHFYNYSLAEYILTSMAKNSLLLLETPTCGGENFRALPNEDELQTLFARHKMLHYDFRLCNRVENNDKRGSLKALIQS